MQHNYDFERITFTNQNFNFEFFYKQMEKSIIELSTKTSLFHCNKVVTSFIGNFSYGITLDDNKQKIQETMIRLNDEIQNDYEIQKLLRYDNEGIDVTLEYTKLYYFYYNKIIKLFGLFLESLNESLMPNTYKSQKKVRFSNNLHFFVSYSNIKTCISENLSYFQIKQFIKPVNSIIVFYYAYKSFVTEEIRIKIEKAIDLLISGLSDNSFLKLLTKQQLSSKDLQELGTIKNDLYKIILKMYSLINEEHSIYDLNPKIERKVYIDKTGI